MINLRDHLLAPAQSKEEVVSRARHLLSNAFIRSQCPEPMQMGHKRIGRRVVILGGSEIGISCARNLSHQGAGKDWHIRLAHQCSLPGTSLPDTVRGRPSMDGLPPEVEQFQEVEVESIEGHLGDFTVVLKEGDTRHRWQADVVCLTDENLLPLSPREEQEGLRSFYRYDFAFFQSPRLGLYRVLPNVVGSMQAFQAGSALAAEVATKTAEAYLQDHLISPRVDPELCRGCGRCEQICPFDTVKMVENDHGFFSAEVLRHNCVGCGGCVSRCPVTAKNMPYFSNRLLDDMLAQSVAADIAAKRVSLVAVTCSWNPYACFNAAGAEQLQVPPNLRMIQVMCIGRINQAMILKAFENGADGVILLGCKDEDCRYGAGPKIGHANIRRVRKLLHLLGVGQERLVERAFSAHETTKLTDALWEFAELIESLGNNPAKPSPDRTLDASRAY
jgi:coenzyme F420-reducing hydrogenase delta subunit/NAD-dependent dihydropyrimidine dehydrogenase PreA subunit